MHALHTAAGILLAVVAIAVGLFVLATLLQAWALIQHQRAQRRAARTIARRERRRQRKT